MPSLPPGFRPLCFGLGQRKPSSQRGYDKTWRRIRAAILTACPLCEHCWDAESEHVDHIRPLEEGGTNEASNLQALCRSCHSHKTATRDGGFGHGKRKR